MLYKFYPREPHAIAFANLLQLHNAEISTFPVGIPLREIVTQLLHDTLVLHAAREKPPAREVLLLGGGDELLNYRAHFLRARLGRLDLLRSDHVVRQIPQKRDTVTAKTIEFSSFFNVIHGLFSFLLSGFLFRLFAAALRKIELLHRHGRYLIEMVLQNVRRFVECRRRTDGAIGPNLNA